MILRLIVLFLISISLPGCIAGEPPAKRDFIIECTAVPGVKVTDVEIDVNGEKIHHPWITGGSLVGEMPSKRGLPATLKLKWTSHSGENLSSNLPIAVPVSFTKKPGKPLLVFQIRFLPENKVKLVYINGSPDDPDGYFDPDETVQAKESRILGNKACNAVRLGSFEEARNLISSGVSVNSRIDGIGASVLELACLKNDETMIIFCLKLGAEIGTSLSTASYYGTPEILELLVDAGANVNGHETSLDLPIVNAIKSGKSENLKWLIDHGADFWSDRGHAVNSPLTIAVSQGNLQATELLASHANGDRLFSQSVINESKSINNSRIPGATGSRQLNEKKIGVLLNSLQAR